MQNKICRVCKQHLPLSSFYKKKRNGVFKEESAYYESCCIVCKNKQRSLNKGQVKEWHKQWRNNNKNHVNQYRKKYREKNYEYLKQKEKDRRDRDYLYRLKINIRSAIYKAYNKKHTYKISKTTEILGCSFEELYNHLNESCKRNYNCTLSEFDNYNIKYHIDHITPVSLASTKEQLIKFNHYSNLQILTEEDNLVKAISKPKLILVIGLSGAGKSYVCNKLDPNKYNYVSYDNNKKNAYNLLKQTPHNKIAVYDPTVHVSTFIRRYEDEWDIEVVSVGTDFITIKNNIVSRGGKITPNLYNRWKRIKALQSKYSKYTSYSGDELLKYLK